MAETRTTSLRRLLLGYELAFLVLVLVTGAMGGLWAYFWQETAAESVRLNELAHTAEEIRTAVFQQVKDVALARMRDDPAAAKVNTRYYRQIQDHFNRLRQHSVSRAEDYSIQNMQEAYGRLQADMGAVFDDPYLLNRIVRLKILDPSYEQALVGGFEKAFGRFRGLVDQALADQGTHIAEWIKRAPVLLPAPPLVALLLLFLSRASLTRGFVRPMREVLRRTRLMSDGDLAQRLPLDGVTEVAQLASSVNRLAADLAASRDALVESERQAALGALVPVVAHNVRNPLAAIRANAQVMEHVDTLEEARDIARDVIITVDRLGRWVSALVSYLHPLKPRTELMPAQRLLDAVLSLIAPRLQEKQVTVRRTPWDPSIMVNVDSDLMEQAIYGLVSNALEASPAGGEILIGINRSATQTQLQIEDRGGGIPFLPEPTGLQPGPTSKRFGTGLGIPVAFKVCKAHGWSLNFEILAEGGTRVTLGAPLVDDQDPDEND